MSMLKKSAYLLLTKLKVGWLICCCGGVEPIVLGVCTDEGGGVVARGRTGGGGNENGPRGAKKFLDQ